MHITYVPGAICTTEEFDQNLQLDFSAIVKKKGVIDYIPWAEIVRTLHKRIPSCTYGFEETNEGSIIHYTPQGNAYLRPFLTRFYQDTGLVVTSPPGFFPVSNMRSRHAALKDPDIREIDNCLRRAIAKEIGLHTGIGLQLWAASDPYDESDEDSAPPNPVPRSRGSSAGSNGHSGAAAEKSSGDIKAKVDAAAKAAGLDDHGKQTVAVALHVPNWEAIPEEKGPKLIQLLAVPDNVALLNGGKNTSGKTINPKDPKQEMSELAAAFKQAAK